MSFATIARKSAVPTSRTKRSREPHLDAYSIIMYAPAQTARQSIWGYLSHFFMTIPEVNARNIRRDVVFEMECKDLPLDVVVHIRTRVSESSLYQRYYKIIHPDRTRSVWRSDFGSEIEVLHGREDAEQQVYIQVFDHAKPISDVLPSDYAPTDDFHEIFRPISESDESKEATPDLV